MQLRAVGLTEEAGGEGSADSVQEVWLAVLSYQNISSNKSTIGT